MGMKLVIRTIASVHIIEFFSVPLCEVPLYSAAVPVIIWEGFWNVHTYIHN